VTERQHNDVVDVLRSRLGVRYLSSLDDGRNEIIRVVSDELKVDRDEAEAMVRQLIDHGHIRYVPRTERDVEYDVTAQRDEYTERDTRRRDADLADPDLTGRSDELRANPIPIGGGPQTISSGLTGVVVAPPMGGGSTTPPVAPVLTGMPTTGSADDLEGGYWDFASDATGVVPSQSRKGQVEPRGT
jgi:hypothetical protein